LDREFLGSLVFAPKGFYAGVHDRTRVTNCFKVVQSETSGKILFCGSFTNTNLAKEKDITEPALEELIGYTSPVLRNGTPQAVRPR
jgi:hypothetical protein